MGFMQSSDSFCNIALVTLSLYPLNNPFTFIVTIVGCSTKLLYFLPAIPTRCPMWWLPNLSWDLVHHCSVSFPIKPQFHHVKSHQDNKTDWPLTIPEQLKVACNCHTSNLDPHPALLSIQQHHLISARYPHLCINQSIMITWHLQSELQDGSMRNTYFDHLQEKFTSLSSGILYRFS